MSRVKYVVCECFDAAVRLLDRHCHLTEKVFTSPVALVGTNFLSNRAPGSVGACGQWIHFCLDKAAHCVWHTSPLAESLYLKPTLTVLFCLISVRIQPVTGVGQC